MSFQTIYSINYDEIHPALYSQSESILMYIIFLM